MCKSGHIYPWNLFLSHILIPFLVPQLHHHWLPPFPIYDTKQIFHCLPFKSKWVGETNRQSTNCEIMVYYPHMQFSNCTIRPAVLYWWCTIPLVEGVLYFLYYANCQLKHAPPPLPPIGLIASHPLLLLVGSCLIDRLQTYQKPSRTYRFHTQLITTCILPVANVSETLQDIDSTPN